MKHVIAVAVACGLVLLPQPAVQGQCSLPEPGLLYLEEIGFAATIPESFRPQGTGEVDCVLTNGSSTKLKIFVAFGVDPLEWLSSFSPPGDDNFKWVREEADRPIARQRWGSQDRYSLLAAATLRKHTLLLNLEVPSKDLDQAKSIADQLFDTLARRDPSRSPTNYEEFRPSIARARRNGAYFPDGIFFGKPLFDERTFQDIDAPPFLSANPDEAYRFHYLSDFYSEHWSLTVILAEKPRFTLRHAKCGKLRVREGSLSVLQRLEWLESLKEARLWERPRPFEVQQELNGSIRLAGEALWTLEAVKGDDYQLLTPINAEPGDARAFYDLSAWIGGIQTWAEREAQQLHCGKAPTMR